MTPLKEFARVSLVEGASDEKRNVVDHVAVCDVVHELPQGLASVGPDIAELVDELVGSFGGETRWGGVRRQLSEEVSVGRTEL